MNDYVSEAEALADIYEYVPYDYDFAPYSDKEKRLYILAKNRFFKKDNVGKFVVVQNARKNKSVMNTLYLVDRKKTKDFWWSHDAFYAMVFNKKSAALIQAAKYKYNKARVVQITPIMADIKGFIEKYES